MNLESINVVNTHAFENCVELKEVTFGNQLTYVDFSCFRNSRIENINLSNNEYYRLDSDMVVSEKQRNICFVNKKIKGDIIIPDDVESIDDFVFSNCKNMTSIDTNHVSNIGMNAFNGCTSLEKVNMSPDISTISKNIFEGCHHVRDLELPFIGSSKDSTSDLNYLFSNTKLQHRLSLKVLDGRVGTKFNGDIHEFDIIDLSMLQQTNLDTLTFSQMTIQKLVLSNEMSVLSNLVFKDSVIGELVANGLEHDNHLIIVDDMIYYCFNPYLTSLVVEAKIKKIKTNALINVRELDSLSLESKSLKIEQQFSHMKIKNLNIQECSEKDMTITKISINLWIIWKY